MDQNCVYFDWALTILVTVVVACLWILPVRRHRPEVMWLLCWAFFVWVLQFCLLEYAMTPIEASGQGEVIGACILVMALLPPLLLSSCCRELVVLVSVALLVFVASQTQQIAVAIPVAVVIGLGMAVLLCFSAVSNLIQVFVAVLYATSAMVFGVVSLALQTLDDVDTLPTSCNFHFNMFVTCDPACGSLLVYDNPSWRVAWGLVLIGLVVLRLAAQACATTTFEEKPKLKRSPCCGDLLKYNGDDWISRKDRKQRWPCWPTRQSEDDSEQVEAIELETSD